MASYPGSIATFTAVTDTTGTIAVDHASLHNQANGEVVAIETTLGINCQGTDASVAAKLIRIDGQSAGTGYVPVTFQLNGITLSGASASLGSAQVVCIGTNQLSTDGSMASDSNNLVPSQKAVVTYVAAQITGGGTVTSVTSTNAYIQVANPTTTPVLTANVGTGTNQIVAVGTNGYVTISIIGGLVGAPVSQTYSTVYQATTDGWVNWTGIGDSGGGRALIYCATNGTPAVVVTQVQYANNIYLALQALIKKGYYYQVTSASGTPTSNGQFFSAIGS